jgi:hypothetical protein
MRQWVDLGLAGVDRPPPALLLDEWNLSSGGFDRRHDDHEGAAFVAGVLAEMQAAELDGSSFFRANDTRTTPGDHGLVFVDGERKPAWWTFWLWQRLGSVRVAVDGTDEGLWAVAARDPGRVSLLVASFSASQPQSHALDVGFEDLPFTPRSATVRRIDGDHASAAAAEPLSLSTGGDSVQLELPAQAVALVELHGGGGGGAGETARAAVAGVSATQSLPATGGQPVALSGLLAAVTGGLLYALGSGRAAGRSVSRREPPVETSRAGRDRRPFST